MGSGGGDDEAPLSGVDKWTSSIRVNFIELFLIVAAVVDPVACKVVHAVATLV